MKKSIPQFYVLVHVFNEDKIVPYDIFPYLIDQYNKLSKSKRPRTEEDLRQFIRQESRYMWWGRCEYEILVDGLFNKNPHKWDVYGQLILNIDVITKLFKDYLGI